VCERGRGDKAVKGKRGNERVYIYVYICVCVCVRERERERVSSCDIYDHVREEREGESCGEINIYIYI